MTKSSTADDQAVASATTLGLRAFERYPVDWQATVQCPDWSVAERIAAANVSRGGMFLRTTRSFSIGARVEVTLQLPDASEVTMLATVKHLQPVDPARKRPGGIGVEVDAAYRNELCALVEIARIRQGKPPELPGGSGPRPGTPQPPVRKEAGFPRGLPCPIVGIDLGTSYSGLAVGVGEWVYPLPDAHGRARFPSLVSYGGSAGKPVVGWDALPLQRTAPDKTIAAVKRLLGRTLPDAVVTRLIEQQGPLRLVPDRAPGVVFDLPRQPLDVVQVSARILRHLKEVAEARLQMPVQQAVFTHPVGFGAAQLQALEQAAQMADIAPLTLWAEPLAVARALGAGAAGQQMVAVCDFGGGSFDCAVVEIGPGGQRLLASASDGELGGDDFDATLAAAIAAAAGKRCGATWAPGSAIWRELLARGERAKRRLAADPSTTVELPACGDEGKPLRQAVDRAAYQRICQDKLRETTRLCGRVLGEAGVTPDQLAHVYLTGGMSHLPFVRQTFEVIFSRKLDEQPYRDEAVALGAALLAAQMAGHPAQQARALGGPP